MKKLALTLAATAALFAGVAGQAEASSTSKAENAAMHRVWVEFTAHAFGDCTRVASRRWFCRLEGYEQYDWTDRMSFGVAVRKVGSRYRATVTEYHFVW